MWISCCEAFAGLYIWPGGSCSCKSTTEIFYNGKMEITPQSTGCVAVFLLLMIYWHIFLSHVKISMTEELVRITSPVDSLIISSAIKLRLVSTLFLLSVSWGCVEKYNFVCFMLWKLYISDKCGNGRAVVIQEEAVVCQNQNLGRWKAAINTSISWILHGDVLQKKKIKYFTST